MIRDNLVFYFMRKKKIISAGVQKKYFPIAGIGASAGGLEACQELLKNLSAKPGMAFVFILHMVPGHKSLLAELFARLTKMPVSEIKSGMPLEANHVYVKPPNTNLSVSDGKLILSNNGKREFKYFPIDYFFRSLAGELRDRSIGVVLSGTATDGTLGAEAIKSAGGIVFAQDRNSAKYSGMPQSVISAGCADFELLPKNIAKELERIAKHPYICLAPVKTDESSITEEKGMERVFDILRQAKGLDFAHYKNTTMSRRISRRMAMLKLEKLKDYAEFLRENKNERENLFDDLLIKVTSFFRDPQVFHTLKKSVLPQILKDKRKSDVVRIWVTGCSSGEEAYSIAIILAELLENKMNRPSVQIFATDISEISTNKARQGFYGEIIKETVSPERLKKFFVKAGNSYKISKHLREMCIFSNQNVLTDPPFSNIDLISCRNLLIYLRPVLQEAVFRNFHYSLRLGGFLILGNSETVGGYANLFKAWDIKQRIFVKKYLSTVPKFGLGRKYYAPKKAEVKAITDINIKEEQETDILDIVNKTVLKEFASCGVLIDSNMEVVLFRGQTGRFLESAAGKPSNDIFKLAREGLFFPLRSAIYQAKKTRHTAKIDAKNIKCNGRRITVNIAVVPVANLPAGRKSKVLKEELFLVLFNEVTGSGAAKNLPKTGRGLSLKGKSAGSNEYIVNLQKELAETRECLKAAIEEHQNSDEEIKAVNEEILSANEELQSTNEELETAKEEMQSLNEELLTANEELQVRNAQVLLLNSDLMNLFSSINIPVIMMGPDFVIRKATHQAEKALNITSSDIGRPISNVKLNVDIPDLEKIALGVIESLHPKTVEVKNNEGCWYSVYIRPYRTVENKIEGVVVVFIDITERKKAEQIVEDAREYAENIIETIGEPLMVLNNDLRVVTVNRAFCQAFRVNPKETQGRFIYDLSNRQWDIPKLRQLLEEVISKNIVFDKYEVKHDFKAIGPKIMLLTARRLAGKRMILITIEDITERRKLEDDLVWAKERQYRALIDAIPQKAFLKDKNSVYLYCNSSYARDLKIKPEEIKGKTDYDFFPPYLADKYRSDDDRIIKTGKSESIKEEYIPAGSSFKNYRKVSVNTIKIPIMDKDGKVTGLAGLFWDITEQRKSEEALRKSKELLFEMTTQIPGVVFQFYDRGNGKKGFYYVSRQSKQLFGLDPDLKRYFQRFCALVMPEDRLNFKASIEKAAREFSEWKYEGMLQKHTGEKICFSGHAVPLRRGNDTILNGILLDVTGYKKMEEKLRESEQRYRVLAESSIDPIFLQDRKGKFLYINQAGARFLGKPPSDIEGKELGAFLAMEERKQRFADFRIAFRKGKNILTERTVKIRGQAHTFLVATAPIFDDKKNVTATVNIAHDITELKKTGTGLTESEGYWEEQKSALERKNIAFREVIEQIEVEKKKIKDDVIANVDKLVMPIIRKLSAKGVTQKYMDLLNNRLQELTSSFGRRLTDGMFKLSPKEIEICNLLEGGLSSKEAARLLNVSYQTIEKHRKGIRKKLGLSHKKVNLITYLQEHADIKT